MKVNVKLTPKEITELVDGKLSGPALTSIRNISSIHSSKEGDLTFLSGKEYDKYLDTCKASCIIIPESLASLPHPNQSFVYCKNPYLAIVTILKHIVTQNKKEFKPEIHHSAIIDESAKIAKNVRIGARCVIGKNCVIADGVELMPNVVLYDNVIVGSNTTIHSNVVCYSHTIIGKNCVVHAGAVIGADGFGFIENPNGSYSKIPQLGTVTIADNVEIGANTTIDCALMDTTEIGDGVKIDNLVHIAHNCHIGANTAIAAQAGIAGSAVIGSRNRIGGQVGVSGHINITDDVILTAQSGISKSITEKGIYFGSPAKERMQAFKIEAYLRRLPEIASDVELLKKQILNNSKNVTNNE